MEPIFEKIITGLPKDEALDLESWMINEIGTIGTGKGPLTNSAIGRGRKGVVKVASDVMFELIKSGRD
jgi:hypothetical protein